MKICLEKFDMVLARHCKTLSELRKVVSPQTLTRIRQGAEIKPATLGRIARELDCDPEDIAEGGSRD